MKCQYCDGTGEHINDANRMTTCEFCGGTGEVKDKCSSTEFCEMKMGDVCTLGSPCPHQEDLLTNEAWFCGLSMEEKAKWLSNVLYACMRCGMNCHVGYCPFGKCIIDKEDALEWLKEKHHDK